MPVPLIVPALVGPAGLAIGGVVKFFRSRKARHNALLAADDATWRIVWTKRIDFGGFLLGRYHLHNESDSMKYRISVQGKDGIDLWDDIDKGMIKVLKSAFKPQEDMPDEDPVFKIRWYLTRKAKKPRTITVKGQ
jgi:hypothetical protein